MAPITQTDSFTVSLDGPQVRDRVLSWFSPLSYKVVADTPDQLELKSGSQTKLRLLGGAFIAGSSLPTRTVVDMAASGGTTRVTLTTSDAMGFGMKTGIKGKYDLWVGEIVSGLRDALTEPASTTG